MYTIACARYIEASLCKLVSRFTTGTQITVNQTGAFYLSQACFEDVSNFSRNKLMIPIVLLLTYSM